MAGLDGAGAELDRDAVQRDGPFPGASPPVGPVLLGAGLAGEPHRLGAQPDPELAPAQDGGGGAMK